MSAVQLNQSAEGAEGLGIIRSNKVGETETVMLNCQVCTVIIMTKKKQKQINKNSIKKKSRDTRDLNPGLIDPKSTYITTTPWRTITLQVKIINIY